MDIVKRWQTQNTDGTRFRFSTQIFSGRQLDHENNLLTDTINIQQHLINIQQLDNDESTV